MSKYKYDKETINTIFLELSHEIKSNAETHEVFLGTRDSNESFSNYLNGELDDVRTVLEDIGKPEYTTLLGAVGAGIEWLVWMRQNGQ